MEWILHLTLMILYILLEPVNIPWEICSEMFLQMWMKLSLQITWVKSLFWRHWNWGFFLGLTMWMSKCSFFRKAALSEMISRNLSLRYRTLSSRACYLGTYVHMSFIIKSVSFWTFRYQCSRRILNIFLEKFTMETIKRQLVAIQTIFLPMQMGNPLLGFKTIFGPMVLIAGTTTRRIQSMFFSSLSLNIDIHSFAFVIWHWFHLCCDSIKELDEAAILHYTYSKFSDLTSRRDRCGCKPTKKDVKRCFMLDFDRAVS